MDDTISQTYLNVIRGWRDWKWLDPKSPVHEFSSKYSIVGELKWQKEMREFDEILKSTNAASLACSGMLPPSSRIKYGW